jgi:O-methyltransferase
MKYPESCIVKKGYFPETTTDVEEEFVFVSIDVDLYEPIYNGLVFFYPRLQHGGYIFVHDYNNASFDGAKVAVQRFAREFKIPFFPLSDGCGTAVFVK